MPELTFTSDLEVPVETLWDWHQRPGVLRRLIPPWKKVKVVSAEPVANGSRTHFKLGLGPVSLDWEAIHEAVNPPHGFVDRQARGPFQLWVHEHRMESTATGSRLTDRIDFALPRGIRARPFQSMVEWDIRRMFKFRHRRMREDLARLCGARPGAGKAVLISGGKGFIGRQLCALFSMQGYEVRILSRSPQAENEFGWSIESGELDPGALEGLHGIIHLAGAGIADRPWTANRRREILESRVKGTSLLVEACRRLNHPPEVFLSASGVNYYPADGGISDENRESGSGFLAEVCRQWETEALKARSFGARVCLFRTGIVLHPDGGALKKMLPAFSLGLGGRLGSGQQHFPWIGLDDLLDLYSAAMRDGNWQGPLNAVSPDSVRQAYFARTLADTLSRPCFLPAPRALLELTLGDMARETLFADLLVKPVKAINTGFSFRHPDLGCALGSMLGYPDEATVGAAD